MSKFTDFLHKFGADLSKVHLRAAFMDVEHYVADLFHHHPHLDPEKRDEAGKAQ